ncbi:HAD-IA family hydrolase [Methylobacillus flagellatus]|uniref:HAD-IA family hydrolase n=1 Tax=Methylobacillus flagellatus TaxID=405 RepID=UPI0010F59DAA|nr:HAD-IA family hydrolase [Methylobacillus flagellatus]
MALVMYDLDGTLIDTAGELADAVNLTLAAYGQPAVEEQQVRAWIGHGAARLMQQAQQMQPDIASDALMARFKANYRQVLGSRSQLFPMVETTLQLLKSAGVKQAIITNKEAAFTDQLLRQHDLLQYFDLVLSGDSLDFRKPDRRVIDHCLTQLRVSAVDSLFVGDSATDIATARNAGVNCWVVPYGYNGGRDVRLDQPDRVIADISEVASLFGISVPDESAALRTA